eukprot:TRINITY_DN5140_c0_g1_i1.p1 TRINITY_DN5140_c0_g1~~TRINITY_DN5140_c0_g1_i1.p1  ORF type:complete len:178 (-),score=35.87 TRINITY_DN5140_c0_g1_i1:44-577(-)
MAKLPFEIYFEDNKPAIVSPADVKAIIEGPSKVVSQTRGAANKFAVHARVNTPGVYTAHVTVRDKFKASGTMLVAAATDPSKCYVKGQNTCRVGTTYQCNVILVDQSGNTLTVPLEDKLEISIAGVEGTFGNLTSQACADATFLVNLEVKGESDFEFYFKVNGVDIGSNPWKVKASK